MPVEIGCVRKNVGRGKFRRIFGIHAVETKNFQLPVVIILQERSPLAMDLNQAVGIGKATDESIFILMEINQWEQEDLKSLLRKFNHVFAWQDEQMPGVDPDVACHKLDINPNTKLVKHKPKRMNPDRSSQVQTEVEKLLAEVQRSYLYLCSASSSIKSIGTIFDGWPSNRGILSTSMRSTLLTLGPRSESRGEISFGGFSVKNHKTCSNAYRRRRR